MALCCWFYHDSSLAQLSSQRKKTHTAARRGLHQSFAVFHKRSNTGAHLAAHTSTRPHVHTLYYILYTIYYILYTIYYILDTIYYIILYTTYYIPYTIHYILYTKYYILYKSYICDINVQYIYIYTNYIWRCPTKPTNHPLKNGIVHEINHPAIGVSPLWKALHLARVKWPLSISWVIFAISMDWCWWKIYTKPCILPKQFEVFCNFFEKKITILRLKFIGWV